MKKSIKRKPKNEWIVISMDTGKEKTQPLNLNQCKKHKKQLKMYYKTEKFACVNRVSRKSDLKW